MPARRGNQYAKGNKGGGAPTKYMPEYVDIAARLCEKGLIDGEIADVLGVCERTIHSWKLAHEEFSAALERSKGLVNDMVEQTLIMKAQGFERKVEKATASGKSVMINEYFPPDFSSIKLWLQNRMPDVYRDRTEKNITHNISDGLRAALEDMSERSRLLRAERARLANPAKSIEHKAELVGK